VTSAGWEAQLLQPITADQPCGESLEDTDKLTSFDTFRIFGQARPLDAPVEQNEKGQPAETRIPKPPESPEWREIRDKALETLGKSKDLRLLACLGTALLRTDGVIAFADTLNVAAYWLDTYWSQTYPLVDEDAILRRNALNCLADPMAVLDGLRKLPLVRSRQHGSFSLRDLDAGVNEEQVRAAFASMPIAELTQLHESVVGAIASLKKIDARMREAAGSEATPSFEQLVALLTKMSQALRSQLASHPEGAGTAAGMEATDDASAVGGASIGGVVKSRQDVVRVLDAAADFIRRTEPSSPIPMLLARAKRLVSKDFLEVLADIAPDAVAQARAAGGLKDGE
jgi:type VI secretion system protein ImpA